jgi:hypothetical protein
LDAEEKSEVEVGNFKLLDVEELGEAEDENVVVESDFDDLSLVVRKFYQHLLPGLSKFQLRRCDI